MKKRTILILLSTYLALSCFLVTWAAAEERCEKGRNEEARLPTNLILSRRERQLVEKVWRRSPTFRFQCDRISQAQSLKVKLDIVPKIWWARKYRALTVVNIQSGLAKVEIYSPNEYVELIGHEFEHLLEQIEGVNLPALAAGKDDQAYRHADGAFETARAVTAGRKVNDEYNRAKRSDDPPGEPCSTRTMVQATGGGRS